MYRKVLFPILRVLSIGDHERAHNLAIFVMQVLQQLPFVLRWLERRYKAHDFLGSRTILGIRFTNRIGLAAGFDKQAKVLLFLQALGFGFVEIGTVLPRHQSGNPHPRLLRIPISKALWNWMGFNSDGADIIAKRLRKIRGRLFIPVGCSLGKQKETPLADAARDYVAVVQKFAGLADYFVINVSSPNTEDLRKLQSAELIEELVHAVVTAVRVSAVLQKRFPQPIFVKFAPDMSNVELVDGVQAAEQGGASGFILGNTSTRPPKRFSPPGICRDGKGNLKGGFSGGFLFNRTLEMARLVRSMTGKPIIGCGGITNGVDALMLYRAKVDLLQIYTALVYQGPAVVPVLRSAA